MKIRTGFVSNSSSSSFCIIGTKNEEIIRQAIVKEGFPINSNGGISLYNKKEAPIEVREGIDYGYWVPFDTKKKQQIDIIFDYINFSYKEDIPVYMGLQASHLLQTRSIEKAKELLVIHLKETLDIDSKPVDFDLYYGECSNNS